MAVIYTGSMDGTLLALDADSGTVDLGVRATGGGRPAPRVLR